MKEESVKSYFSFCWKETEQCTSRCDVMGVMMDQHPSHQLNIMKEKGRDRERTVIGVERREERDDDRRLEERPLHHRRRCLN